MPTIKYDWNAAWLLFVVGGTHEEISERLNIPLREVIEHSSRKKWRDKRTEAQSVAHQSIKRDLKKRVERARDSHTHFMLDQLEHTAGHIENLAIKAPGIDEDDKTKVSIEQKLNLVGKQHEIASKVLKLDEVKDDEDQVRKGFLIITQAPPRPSLVNEKQVEGHVIEEITQGENIYGEQKLPSTMSFGTPKRIESTPPKPIGEPEKTSSAIDPLPDQSDANTGILRPFNGHINGPVKEPNVGPSDDKPGNRPSEPGNDDQIPPKPL
jgi:hypothetical protein